MIRTFAPNPKATQQTTSANSTIPGRTHFGQSREVSSIVQLQRTIGNQAVKRLLEANTIDGRRVSTIEIARFGHDFSRIPERTTSPMPVQPRVTTGTPRDRYDKAGTRRAGLAQEDHRPTDLDRAAQTHDDLTPDTFSFGALSISPIPAPVAGARSSPTIPTADDGGNAAPAGPSPVASTPATNSCSQPRSMNKIVSGTFLGGLTMDSYYPLSSGRGFWAHGDTGGRWDTGTAAGGNAQLYGVIPSPCTPSQFHLEQTANIVRFRIGGVPQRLEGTTVDDIARSGRDFSRAPSRQDFLGGGAAPPGYIISMADWPYVSYGPSQPDVERDVNFVSSLVGPGGRQSVTWAQSIRVKSGAVTVNTLT